MGRMGVIHRRLATAVAGYSTGVAATAVGAGLQWGLGVGLIVGGVATAASCVVLLDIPEDGAS